MQMRFFLLPFAAFLSGCGTQLPDLVSPHILPLDHLVRAIRCELDEAVREQVADRRKTFFRTWQGTYTITLKGNETGSLAADGNKFPFDLARSAVVISAGANVKTSANRTAVMSFVLNVGDVLNSPPCAPDVAVAGHPFLRGRIGFGEWMRYALDAGLSDVTIGRHPEKLRSIGHTFQFVITAGAGISGEFTIVPKPITLNPALAVTREEDNSVQVALAAPEPAEGAEVVSKVTSPSQRREIARLQEQRREGQRKIAEAQKVLSSEDGLRLQALQKQVASRQAELTALGVRLPADIMNVSPDVLNVLPDQVSPKSLPAAQSALADLQRLAAQLAKDPAYQPFLQARRQREEALSTVDEAQREIAEINANPQDVQVTRTRGGVRPAALNSTLNSTAQQLTLERLLGNARIRGF
jgi:hypothetical protein